MFKNASLQIALIVSIFVHFLLLYFLPNIRAFQENKQLTKDIEVVYKRLKMEPGKNISSPLMDKAYAKQKIISPKDIALKNKEISSPFLKDRLYEDLKISHNKEPVLPKLDMSKKKVSLPDIEQPKIKNPAYLGYYQEIRERIKLAAYSNYTGLEEGEVCLSFVIKSDGGIKEVKILDERSSDSAYLKDVSIKSIHDSSPYPAFPKELNYPQLSFNVIISYEVD